MDRERANMLIEALKNNALEVKRAQNKKIAVSDELKIERQRLIDDIPSVLCVSVSQLTRLLGMNHALIHSWRSCSSSPTPSVLRSLRIFVEERTSAGEAELSDNMLKAMMDRCERSQEALSVLARARYGVGFDLSAELYAKIIDEWRANHPQAT